MTSLAQHQAEFGDWITPPDITEMARDVVGDFDLDPASSQLANDLSVQAARFYTREDDGLTRVWGGRVWINAPGNCGRDPETDLYRICKAKRYCQCKLVPRFWRRLVAYHLGGNVPRAAWMGFNLAQLAILQDFRASPLTFPTVILRKRTAFMGKGGKDAPSHNNFLSFPGCEPGLVREVFEGVGESVQMIGV